jgi:hypothetical protein
MRSIAQLTRWKAAVLILTASFLHLPAASAQPFGLYLRWAGDTGTAYFNVPHSPALNPPSAITLEAWVYLATPFATCRTVVGKDYVTSYWFGVCGNTVRAYFRGSASAHNAGVVPANRFTHIAVTYDGTTQKHYIDGELIQSFPVSGPPTASTAPLRIGGDISWPHSPPGLVAAARLWSVARTEAQIRSTINRALSTPQPGLVAAWPFQSLVDPVGGHNGTLVGEDAGVEPSGLVSLYGLFSCTPGASPQELCLRNRFLVDATFRTGAPGTAEAPATVASAANPGSGLFWFFAPDNWEIMVKEIDGCGLNSRHWIFSAATTTLFYRMQVYDGLHGEQRIYINYPGPPAPAVTDTDAFATCP